VTGTAAALAAHRARPLPIGWLALVTAGWAGIVLLAAWKLAPGIGPGATTTAAALAATGLGSLAGFMAAPGTDPPLVMLAAAPVSWERTLAARLTVWLGFAAAVLVLAGLPVPAAGRIAPATMALVVVPSLLLTGGMAALVARRDSGLAGAATALGLAAALITAGVRWHGFPLRVLADTGLPGWERGRLLTEVAGLVLLLLALAVTPRRGYR
jgi:hypothetical protein